jgi:hypothetical protein
VVTDGELPEGLWVRPDQAIQARQSVAPLNRTITAFGELVPQEERIDATDVTLGGAAVPAPEWLEDWFAPAQFDRLDDTTRLSSPSYELMTAGVRFGADGVGISADPDRECTSVSRAPEDSLFPRTPRPRHVYVSPARPAASATIRRTVGGTRIAVLPTAYTVVRTKDGLPATDVLADAGGGTALPYAAAIAVLAGRTAEERARLRVAPAHVTATEAA